MEDQKAQCIEVSVKELETEMRRQRDRIESLDRIYSSTQQTAAQLREDIRTSQQLASCAQMRSAVDNQEENTDFCDDIKRRGALIQERIQLKTRLITRLRELTDSRALQELQTELTCGNPDSALQRYRTSCTTLVSMCTTIANGFQGGLTEKFSERLHSLLLQHHIAPQLAHHASLELAQLQERVWMWSAIVKAPETSDWDETLWSDDVLHPTDGRDVTADCDHPGANEDVSSLDD